MGRFPLLGTGEGNYWQWIAKAEGGRRDRSLLREEKGGIDCGSSEEGREGDRW